MRPIHRLPHTTHIQKLNAEGKKQKKKKLKIKKVGLSIIPYELQYSSGLNKYSIHCNPISGKDSVDKKQQTGSRLIPVFIDRLSSTQFFSDTCESGREKLECSNLKCEQQLRLERILEQYLGYSLLTQLNSNLILLEQLMNQNHSKICRESDT